MTTALRSRADSRAFPLLLAAAIFAFLAVGDARAQQASEAASSEAAAEQPATPAAELAMWFQRAARAYAEQDHQAWVRALENLRRLRPFNYDFMRQLVMGYALTGQTSKAFNTMLIMQQQGLAADWDSVEEVASLRQYPLYGHLSELMKGAAEPGGNAEDVWTIPGRYAMPEALAHDADSGRIFVGTVHDGVILVRGPEDDAFEVFASAGDIPGLHAVFDLLADERRGHLWVATGITGHYSGARTANVGRTALLKLDLETGELLSEHRVTPDGRPHMLGAMALAADGTVYAADGSAPLIYRLAPGGERPEVFTGHPVFTGLRGIALSADESKLYVADYDLGIFFFDMASREGFSLGIPENLNVGGIDGLYAWNGHLVAIQNGVTPQRVLRLELDDSGTRVASVATLARALPSFDNPTFGTVAGDDLLFLAASHWHRVGPDGRPVATPLPDVPVLRADIAEARNIVAGEEMLEKLKQEGSPVRPPQGD